jgi:hypothetical protein
MPPRIYLCEHGCGKEFSTKGRYDQHMKRKTSCAPNNTLLNALIDQKLQERFGTATPAQAPEPTAPEPTETTAPEPSTKKTRGQFYTTNSAYILAGATVPTTANRMIEPFAGQGDLLKWFETQGSTLPVEAYDIEPKHPSVVQRDTLADPPNYANAWILTNPPYLARNKSASKTIFDQYGTNDLYKCFIMSLTSQPTPAAGGLIIIPAGFFFSPRDLDVCCRQAFMSKYKLTRVRYFEETVFPDTPTTVVAVAFERSPIYPVALTEQHVEWVCMPSGQTRTFHMTQTNDWIIGGDIYKLTTPKDISLRRHVEGQPLKPTEQQTFMTLNALDSGTQAGRISLTYKDGYIYPAQECSRAYATLRILGRTLTATEQQRLCDAFNQFIEQKRTETWSLFLPQFRESKEYARKRIPFELVYSIVLHLIGTLA